MRALMTTSTRRTAPPNLSVSAIQALLTREFKREGVVNLRAYLVKAEHQTAWKTAPQK